MNNSTTVSLPSGLTNHGTMLVNAQAGGGATPVLVGAGGALSGTGSLVLNASSGFFDRAYVSRPDGEHEQRARAHDRGHGERLRDVDEPRDGEAVGAQPPDRLPAASRRRRTARAASRWPG